MFPLGFPPVHKNMPLVAGALRWAQELRARIQAQFGPFRHITHPCVAVPDKLFYDYLGIFNQSGFLSVSNIIQC